MILRYETACDGAIVFLHDTVLLFLPDHVNDAVLLQLLQMKVNIVPRNVQYLGCCPV